jgi:hypothetical protein
MNSGREFGKDVAPITDSVWEHGGVATLTGTTNKMDRGGEPSLAVSGNAILHFCVNRPRCGNNPPSVDDSL